MVKDRKLRPKKSSAVTLKAVAEHVGLTPGTVSAVLNNAPSSRSIPEYPSAPADFVRIARCGRFHAPSLNGPAADLHWDIEE